MSQGPIAVTGASGFIGKHLCTLLLDRGMQVRALSRQPLTLAGVDTSVITADSASLSEALQGVSAVVHLAGRAHVMRDVAPDIALAYREANVDLTRRLLAAATSVGVDRLVFASSVKAVGESTSTPWNEWTPASPVDAYGESKLAAEQLVLDVGRHRPDGVVLRLPMVYGAGVKGNMRRLIEWVDRGRPVLVGATPNRRSMAYVGNVSEAILAVLLHPAASGQRFFVADGPPVSTELLVSEVARNLGRSPHIVRMPTKIVETAAAVADLLHRVPGAAGLRSKLDRLTSSLELDASHLTRVTGFQPPYSFEDGIHHMVAHYRRSVPR